MSPIKKHALETARILREAGHRVYFAGGAVRDGLLGIEPKDYDLATSAHPHEVIALFPHSDCVGAHFGVVIVKGKDLMIEVATFRSDGSYRDGRRPDQVIFSSPEEDALRRDYTINGLFQDPFSGEIHDFVGGQADLKAGIIRAIGEPAARFREDALRLMRGVRLAVTTGFMVEKNLLGAMKDNAHLLAQISPERIRDELSKILIHSDRARGLDLLTETRLAEVFFPEVLALQGCEQPPQWHPEGDVYAHTRLALSLLEAPPLELALAVLLHDIGKPATQTWDPSASRFRFNGHDQVGAKMAAQILGRWRYPNRVIDQVSSMVARHMTFMHVQEMRIAKLRRFMASETFLLELELHRVDCDSSNGLRDHFDFLLKKIDEFSKAPLIPSPLLSGRDLIQVFSLSPGPTIGKILQAVQTEQLEGHLTTREEALDYVSSTFFS